MYDEKSINEEGLSVTREIGQRNKSEFQDVFEDLANSHGGSSVPEDNAILKSMKHFGIPMTAENLAYIKEHLQKWVDIQDDPDYMVCPKCEGRSPFEGPCDHCDSYGRVPVDESDEEIQCPRCLGKPGQMVADDCGGNCPICNNTGRVKKSDLAFDPDEDGEDCQPDHDTFSPKHGC
jgi:hypothetical protein